MPDRKFPELGGMLIVARSMLTMRNVSHRIAELIVAGSTPGLMLTSEEDKAECVFLHAFGVTGRPRYRIEQPYDPDAAWSLEVDPMGALAGELPVSEQAIVPELHAFFERPLDELSHRLLEALPSGRYMIIRSPRVPRLTAEILLGNELVPALPNVRSLYYERPLYAAVFGADAEVAPSMSGLLLAVALLSYNGDRTLDGTWLLDMHGNGSRVARTDELAVVLPIEGPLVLDTMAMFQKDGGREAKARWMNERAPMFVRWLSGEGESM